MKVARTVLRETALGNKCRPPDNSFLAERAARGLVRIGIVATVTVGDMDVAVEPIGIYLRRVTGETMTIHAAQLTTKLSCFGAKAFRQMNSSMVVKIAIVATVAVGSMSLGKQ
ncbi:hypothetical protein [Shewanella baltica]|uniref:hypothetical protein n=1 Tax=Shewanella baltica TaxID=62322 RepID=UPI0001F32898|nr:hypothetical protein [Shewanella baltica]ADT96407.1 hypothetical protein Sbal678_4281 [Shewanella baltica OS678]